MKCRISRVADTTDAVVEYPPMRSPELRADDVDSVGAYLGTKSAQID
jgi:hypothetical protein